MRGIVGPQGSGLADIPQIDRQIATTVQYSGGGVKDGVNNVPSQPVFSLLAGTTLALAAQPHVDVINLNVGYVGHKSNGTRTLTRPKRIVITQFEQIRLKMRFLTKNV